MLELSYSEIRRLSQIVFKFTVMPGTIKKISVFSGGRINKTYMVTIKDDKKEMSYLLQSINVGVFKNPEALMNNIIKVTNELRNKGNKTIDFIKAKDSENFFVKVGSNYWRAYELIEADVFDCISKPKDMELLGNAVADFALQLKNINAKSLIETIPDFHNTRKRFEHFLIAVILCMRKEPEKVRIAKETIDYIISEKDILSILVDGLATGDLPYRVTHNDPKLNNVLFDKNTGNVICMIDLDTVMPGTILYDIGDAIRYGANTVSEEEKCADMASIDLELYEKFVKGFIDNIGDCLKPKEYDYMALSVKIMTLELAIRFLTDYLEGDKYFSVNYPTHNLDRANVQIAFNKSVSMHLKEMTEIVDKYRKDK